jgi:hypothetical protein
LNKIQIELKEEEESKIKFEKKEMGIYIENKKEEINIEEEIEKLILKNENKRLKSLFFKETKESIQKRIQSSKNPLIEIENVKEFKYDKSFIEIPKSIININ